MKTLYFNGNIYTGSGFTHSLLEENGVILAMGDAAAMRAEGAKAFDLEGICTSWASESTCFLSIFWAASR